LASQQDIFDDAVAHQRRGNHKGAVKRFKLVLKQSPDHPQILNLCARSLAELNDFRSAESLLNRAIKSDPDHAESYGNLGSMLELDGKFEAAAEAYDRVRSLNPESPFGHVRFADACQKMERYGDALKAYERGLAIDPDDANAWSGLSRVSMFEGEWEKGLDSADRALSRDPGNSLLLAIKSVAFSELGRKGETAELVNFEKLIEVQHFSAPDVYADMKSFNDALCAHCLAHPTLVYEPSGKSTMKGHQTDDISQDGDKTPISPLRDMIVDAIRGYQKTHPLDPSHPFLAQKPDQWGAYIWATVLESSGHQASHIHPSGWLSGVYYVKIPDVISASSEDKAGWIEFGEAARYPHSKAENDVRLYQPQEGMVVLFPSYFYHRTVPFESDDQRISIAFDIVPVDQAE
jgi:tetratricopeptide (TPR) repeat protein